MSRILYLLLALFMFSAPTSVFAQGKDKAKDGAEAAEEIAEEQEVKPNCKKLLGKCVSSKNAGLAIEMRQACAKFRNCKKNCRSDMSKAKGNSRVEKRDCKSVCKNKKGKAKKRCNKACRQGHKSNKKDARKDKRNCKNECISTYGEKGCFQARKAFWGGIFPCLKEAAPQCIKELTKIFKKKKGNADK
mgnify:CR=1 FL=1